MSKLATKIVQNKQRNCINAMLFDQRGKKFSSSLVRANYFPDSSGLLQNVLHVLQSPISSREVLIGATEDAVQNSCLAAISCLDIVKTPTRLCFFPNYSVRQGVVISDFPVLEVGSSAVGEWYFAAQQLNLQFFFCSVPSMSHGMALDIYAGEPAIHGSDGPVYEILKWANYENKEDVIS